MPCVGVAPAAPVNPETRSGRGAPARERPATGARLGVTLMRSAMAAYDEPRVAVPTTAPAGGDSSRRGRPRVVAVVPAHDEEAGIAAAVASLHAQSIRPDRIVVVADNCTDRTARLAAEAGAEVIE